MPATATRLIVSTCEAYPGVTDRLLGTAGVGEGGAAYRKIGGYQPLTDPDALLTAVSQAGLRGRGGAAFPLERKIVAVRDAAGAAGVTAVVVANGEEGEPASVKDRWLMRYRPHLVLDGLRLAAALTGAQQLHAYVSDPESATSLRRAAAQAPAGTDGALAALAGLVVTTVEARYVAGEETAAVRAIDGGPALPTDKPPRPFQRGVGGLPTLVSNVETLAHLALVHRSGTAADGGTAPGSTFLLTLTSPSGAGLFEVPFGVTLREILLWRGENPDAVQGLMMGGYFAGLAGPAVLDVPLDHDGLKAAGTGLGCGAVAILGPGHCPVSVAAGVMRYFARENAGQCGSCFNGTAAMAVVLDHLRQQCAQPAELDRLAHWSRFLPGRGACGTLDGAAAMAATLLREFPAAVAAHRAGSCSLCACEGAFEPEPADIPFAVEPPTAS